MRFQQIVDYDMNLEEAEAFKIALIYESEYQSVFGKIFGGENYRKNSLPKKNDPRKSNLFRYCWKLRRETRGLLTGVQYQQYIEANFKILKMNFQNGDKKGKVRIEPNVLCGDKAWIRWKTFERWKKIKADEINTTAKKIPLDKLSSEGIRDVIRTKKFLFKKCDGEPTIAKLQEFYDKGFLKIWIMSDFIAKIYIIRSTFISKICNPTELMLSCGFDPLITEEKITDEVAEYFDEEFEYEVIK